MRKGFARCNAAQMLRMHAYVRQLDTWYNNLVKFDTTAEDDLYLSSDLDLQNRKMTQSRRRLHLARRASQNEKNSQSDINLPSKSLYRCQDLINRQEVDTKLFFGGVTLNAPANGCSPTSETIGRAWISQIGAEFVDKPRMRAAMPAKGVASGNPSVKMYIRN
ncbi:hypothetical protein PUN28_018124 [Cardiocondyla obscurior]|uniref:Uncharacterized protein n=1 Tax=Cardiocondyla obscurior TaxID=286306 RepID=A0AAW2EL95_9HYME